MDKIVKTGDGAAPGHGGFGRAGPVAALVAAVAVVAGVLGGCAGPVTRPHDTAVVAPPAALTMTGVPPVPASLPARVGPYTEFRGAGLADITPDGRSLLAVWRAGPKGAERTQLHLSTAPGQALQQITTADEPTRSGNFVPADPNLIVFERDRGGNEATQVFRRDLRSGQETALTEPGQRCDAGVFNRAGTAVTIVCAKVDAAAAGAGGVANSLWLVEVHSGRVLGRADLPGTGWWAADVLPDDRALLVNRYISASQSEVWRVDLASGQRSRVLPREGDPPAVHFASAVLQDARRFLVVTDRFGEFRQAYRYDPAAHRFDPLTADVAWDVSASAVSRDLRRAVFLTNEAGVGVPRLYDLETLRPLPLPLPRGTNVTAVRLSDDARRLVYTVVSPSAPSEVRVLELQTAAPQPAAGVVWVAADTAGIDTRAFAPVEQIAWKSFDGRTITGLIQRPPPKFTGKRPVLIEIHGGPEGQARVGFNGRYNYIVNELGIAFIEPNVRGSTGFGKTFHQLDNGRLREDSVKDIGALLDWIAQQPDLDASRVVVQGGSYGGYMANAVAVHYADRIRGAMPAVGISNFVTFLERTESYRRDLRRAEYGDERDPAMRQWMQEIAPLNNAHRIKAPLFVIHGRNDPRVPVQEAEQIARTVAANGVPVWTMIAENEGHGFAKKENADHLFYARILFLDKVLLGR
ncbi:MAG: prolyl oligopeptidase family serine peptidase [Rubrivivax sp.]